MQTSDSSTSANVPANSTLLACGNPFATLDRDYLTTLTQQFGSKRKSDVGDGDDDESTQH